MMLKCGWQIGYHRQHTRYRVTTQTEFKIQDVKRFNKDLVSDVNYNFVAMLEHQRMSGFYTLAFLHVFLAVCADNKGGRPAVLLYFSHIRHCWLSSFHILLYLFLQTVTGLSRVSCLSLVTSPIQFCYQQMLLLFSLSSNIWSELQHLFLLSFWNIFSLGLCWLYL